MSSGHDPANGGGGYPYGQSPSSPGQNPAPGYQVYDPVTGQPLPPGPAAYSAVDPYAAPPAYQTGYPPTPLPAAGYPGYGAPAGYQLVPMYPLAPARPAKPGAAVAAAVLAYVQSGFVLIGGITMFSGSTGFGGAFRLGAELSIVAIVTVVAGALLIAGATTLLNRKPTLLTVGCLLSIAVSIYFVIRLANFIDGIALWVPILFAVLPIISVALIMGSEVRAWVRARDADA